MTVINDDAAFEQVCAGILRVFEPRIWLNALVYFLGGLTFGIGIWRSLLLAAIVFVATRIHYGRRTILRIGMGLLFPLTAIWVGLLPWPSEWHARMISTIAEIRAAG